MNPFLRRILLQRGWYRDTRRWLRHTLLLLHQLERASPSLRARTRCSARTEPLGNQCLPAANCFAVDEYHGQVQPRAVTTALLVWASTLAWALRASANGQIWCVGTCRHSSGRHQARRQPPLSSPAAWLPGLPPTQASHGFAAPPEVSRHSSFSGVDDEHCGTHFYYATAIVLYAPWEDHSCHTA
jgi:hypothetical protein